MAVYFVTGKLGSGKSLACIDKIRDYLSAGRRVATNLDLYLDEMFTWWKEPAIRLPDKPRVQDMKSLGKGYDCDDPRDYDESKFGLIVLDECGTWLNTREWNDKERRPLLDWFLHARKLGWDIMFIIQDIEACDAQIVRSLCEHLVVCRRMDRFKIAQIRMPKVHIANVYYGRTTETRVDRWTYKAKDLYSAYDTRQVFRDGFEFYNDGPVDMRAPYTMLSAWHLKGRYMDPPPEDVPLKKRFKRFWLGLLIKPVLLPWAVISVESMQRTLFHKAWKEAHLQQYNERRKLRGTSTRLSNILPPEREPKQLHLGLSTIMQDLKDEAANAKRRSLDA